MRSRPFATGIQDLNYQDPRQPDQCDYMAAYSPILHLPDVADRPPLLVTGAVHDPRVLVRAAYVLHQPSSGNPHRDHFHVRIRCTAQERAAGCTG